MWFLIGLIILCGIVYLAIWVIEQFIQPIPTKVKQGVWVIVLIGSRDRLSIPLRDLHFCSFGKRWRGPTCKRPLH